MSIIYKKESYNLVEAFYDVFNQMDSGFLQAFYQEALPTESQNRNIPSVIHLG